MTDEGLKFLDQLGTVGPRIYDELKIFDDLKWPPVSR